MLPNQIPAADPEIVGLGSALSDLIVSIKAKGTVLADLSAMLPDLLAAGAAVSNIGADILKPANQVYLLWSLAQALEPAPVVAAAAKA